MEHFSKALAFVSRTAQSAQELLRDKELRSKGIQTVVSGAQIRLQSIQNGIVQRAGILSERLQDRQRQLQTLLATLEERLNSSQRAWQLQASRRAKVDVQFGRQLIADAPQEVRARLWYVLLENPHLAAPIKCQQAGAVANQYTDDGADSDEPAAYAASNSDPFSGSEMDGWEIIGGVVGPMAADGSMAPSASAASAAMVAAHPEAIRIIMERLEALGPLPLDESGSDPLLVAQQAVLEAMLQVPWEPGVGLPADPAPDCRFIMLNEMTAGQEEVDDSILRDIHRTFPEHPYFGMEAGQRALFRVLKGMAFMAGVLLMYVPEEVAFRLFCRLMDPEGPNLRRLYLPGLEPLKAELATFDLLLSWRLPELAKHLTAFGLPPVLYVSQWLMTLFATPFPPPFCARVIDVLLQDGHDRLLLRCSFAVIEALEEALLERHDFEALITYLKMEPVTWGITRQRAIMDRALNSPIGDEEIDVARETVASRQYLSASDADGEAAADGHGAGMGAGTSAAPDLLGPALTAGSQPLQLPTQLSFEHEVEAALAAAAVTLTAADAGFADDVGKAAPRGAAGAGRSRCQGGDMIALEDDEEHAHWGGTAGRGPMAAARVQDGGSSGRREFHPGSSIGVELDARTGTGREASASAAQPPSLVDELGFLAGSTSAVTHGSQPAAELEYGEYGELLLDAGVLLPALDATGQAPAAVAGTHVVGSSGALASAPAASNAVASSAAEQRGRPQGGDLLLD
ncbi:hypothetical protein GPECTOR_1g84 [Gonium pectorale]|uniref:Rab-GAP TBC domain-containing protein n=1 Tax=Gonium pectorale TaxID=33097 RepID=A0A150H4D9_GONPE|nr:hypothetical protein GPECTOR_1g84 [Gonium pectorale]|eukprot:KXZ56931.1 hypothetical protein GPECTOR_1g84 [Gonium pectorale]